MSGVREARRNEDFWREIKIRDTVEGGKEQGLHEDEKDWKRLRRR